MKPAKRQVVLITIIALVVAAVLASRGLCRCHRTVDTRGWRLPHLVDHLQESGVWLRVVPSRQDGRWADSIYLTLNQDATWDSFQRKNLNAERIHEWEGSIYVHQIGELTDVEGHLVHWQTHGLRVGRFLFFGDTVLIDRIRASLRVQ